MALRILALFSAEARGAAAEMGFQKIVVIDKARQLLGFSPRPSGEAVVAAGKSMIANGLV
ncbi:hypothetical protein ACPXCG_08710 [Gordonia sp. DT218]|uniref:hypothetical protein n=1 Tax=unclassified Gordonia (in: high G+C Gram-positive bacteria) TaxID=2657482 RepID=UPI003CF1BA69